VLRPEVTDVNEVVRETLRLIERLIGENIETRMELAADVKPIVVDRGQFGQVLLNLAVNARDAMPQGGTLDLRTRNVVLEAGHAELEPGAYVLLQITDTGAGMDPETRARIFDPFFTTKDEGTGLGLATVWGVVRQSGGQILVYSERGFGTTFKLYFPVAEEALPAPSPAPTVEAAPGTETILLAEDEDQVRTLIAKALRLDGYTVIEARNGIEALQRAHEHSAIDLLLTDVVMPGLNGRELWERLSAERPGLPALFTSGYPADTVLRHGIAEGRVSYIEKPYLPSELALKIREVLDS
jgi:two-component system, cell cycle sensor histidine kinase and response regulator CckA